ncbi:MAG: bifunctional aspartate transaminase/aspartate 4-decarboxylase, partial [Thiohalocapsa sp.]
RHAFFQLGLFAMTEAERCSGALPPGVAGLPERAGIAARFDRFAEANRDAPGISFLKAALSYGCSRLSFSRDAFVHELVQGVLGCQYPEPVRLLPLTEQIVQRYLLKEIAAGHPIPGSIDLFAVEGATAGVTYLFNTLRINKLIAPGDAIAIGTPIFTPYLEIPQLDEYRLVEVMVEADPGAGWQYPESELAKLLDPQVKVLLLVNPGNPTSVKIDHAGLNRIATIVAAKRPDLIIVTDDVYATFADDFVSLFALCPRNTVLVYSFSKYFGTTGWRLGVVATHARNIIDDLIAELPEADRLALDARYGSLVLDPRKLKFIDRLVADSRAVAFNHTAGLSTPQQVQLALFALFGLLDEQDDYKTAMKRLIRRRHQALYGALGIAPSDDPNAVDYYAVLDLEILGSERYGQHFVDWLLATKNPLEILFRLAEESGVVLLPGKGFATPHPSARVSLANLDEADCARIGRIIRSLMEDYLREYRAADGQNINDTAPS